VEVEENVRSTENSGVKGVCMECAMQRHAFSESTARQGKTGHLDYIHLPEALIDGRRHVLLSATWTHQEICADCRQTRPMLYVPLR